jgi:hypothetical protein
VNPNALAWLALAAWPIITLVVYGARRSSARVARTTAWMMILPVMFLPAQIHFDGPGHLDKHRISFLSIWIALQVFHRRELSARAPSRAFPRLVLLALVLGAIQTVRTNADALTIGRMMMPALDTHDAVSIAVSLCLGTYLPFVVGQQIFRTERDLRDLLEVLALCGLIYLPFCLVELRLSPQFSYWAYGYTPGSFLENKRAGGFRPIVFMNHGLSVAMFSFSTFAASMALYKARASLRTVSAGLQTTMTGALVLLCKSLGAMVYSLATLPLRLFLSSEAVSRVAAALAIVVIAFPVMRAEKVFPTKEIVGFFARISQERADSLAFRFANEDALVDRAMERPLYGWGTYGRNRIYAPDGSDLSVTDGLWILRLGMFGWAGLVGFFAFMIIPVLRFFRHRARMSPTVQVLGSTLALMVAVFAIDFLPNYISDLLPLTYAGALLTLSDPLRLSGSPRGPKAPAAEPQLSAKASVH